MKPYMINQNDLFEEAQNFVKRVERMEWQSLWNERFGWNEGNQFEPCIWHKFAITKAMFPCEMEDGGSKK